MSKKENNSIFTMYLDFTFDERVDLFEVKERIEKETSIQWVEYGLRGIRERSAAYIKTMDIEIETVDIEDVAKIFLARHGENLDKFNKISEMYMGSYTLEVVIKINKKQMPALYFDEKFLAFTKGLNKLRYIDIDMY